MNNDNYNSNQYDNNNQPVNSYNQNMNNQNIDNQNMNNHIEQNNTQYSENNYYPGNNYNSAGQLYTQPTINYSYAGNPVAQEVPGKQPKKKRRFFGAFRLVASAVVFGIVAGAVFQGYYLITQPAVKSDTQVEEEDNLNIKVAEVADQSGDTVVPATNAGDTIVTDVSGVVANVMPSIVAINASATVTSYDFFGREFNQPMEGSGSGIIIAQNGSEILIATNNHVIEDADEVEIVFVDDTTATAKVKGTDPKADLAVVSVDLDTVKEETIEVIKVATLGDSDEAKPGEMAIAIGNALGYGQSVTVGYISAVNREVTIEDQVMTLLQTDAAINPGNSGGALINASGHVIGINTVKFATEAVEGMGYAIPISRALPIINDLMKREVVEAGEQGFLGIDASTAQNVTELYAERFNMPIGVYINDVIAGSPAEEAGLMQGDIITGIDATKIETIEDLISTLQYKKAGQAIDLKIQVKENGKYVEKTLKVTLGQKVQ